MSNDLTLLKKIKINNFRGLEEVNLNLGERITLICGKNGTSKSTILGIIAQIFNFETDHISSQKINFKTLNNNDFKSPFSEHFRFSKAHDKFENTKIEIELYDAYFQKTPKDLQLTFTKSKDRPFPRPVVRNNVSLEEKEDQSRSTTHPVIYLSLSRLMPISTRTSYDAVHSEYLNKPENKKRFTDLTHSILNNTEKNNITTTDGTIKSAVAHGDNYDHESVSVGEDNIGQIVLAIMSFEKLKSEYKDYHGGILLIDEADASLFPAAQKDFIKILTQISGKLNIQVIITSHSPTMISSLAEYHHYDNEKYKIIYLTDTYGPIRAQHDWGWHQIEADLNIETITQDSTEKLPKVNVYFEDNEAYIFFNAMVKSRTIRTPLVPMKNITIGCEQYKTLISSGVNEFSKKSVIVFDGDVKRVNHKNCIKLPTNLPPDQLLFQHLINKEKSDEFWKNDIMFSKPAFMRLSSKIVERLNIQLKEGSSEKIDILKLIKENKHSNPAIRELFKEFYNSEPIQKLLRHQKTNPFSDWAKENPIVVQDFNSRFVETVKHVLRSAYGAHHEDLINYNI